MLILAVHGLLEGIPGLLGLGGLHSKLYSGGAVLFQQQYATAAESLIFGHVYSLLAFAGGLSYMLLYRSKSASNDTSALMPYLFGGALYHLLVASFCIHRLMDHTGSAVLPGPDPPAMVQFLGREELRWLQGGLAVGTHGSMAVWFIVSIINASEDWKEPLAGSEATDE
ncbi:hypothetical protein BDR26DRAFT_852025 [Obelidium mucronatum]|nr:hypothetical protein BDR26DRAFT_852025 [Obelidium mucronatum]